MTINVLDGLVDDAPAIMRFERRKNVIPVWASGQTISRCITWIGLSQAETQQLKKDRNVLLDTRRTAPLPVAPTEYTL